MQLLNKRKQSAMASATIAFRVKPEIKRRADLLFSQLGMSTSTGMNVLLMYTLEHRGFPHGITLGETRTDEEEAFRMVNAVLKGDTRTALLCLGIKKKNREEPIYVLSQINKTFSDLSAAALFIKDGRDLKDYTKSMRLSEYPAKLRYSAAKLRSTEYFEGIMEKAVEADRMIKNGADGYSTIERLICGAGK